MGQPRGVAALLEQCLAVCTPQVAGSEGLRGPTLGGWDTTVEGLDLRLCICALVPLAPGLGGSLHSVKSSFGLLAVWCCVLGVAAGGRWVLTWGPIPHRVCSRQPAMK